MADDPSTNQSLHLSNLMAEHINVIQIGNPSDGDISSAFGAALKSEFNQLARQLLEQQEVAVENALGKIHIEGGKQNHSFSAVVNAFTAAASGDRLMSFEIKPYITAVSDFLVSNPDFCRFLMDRGEPVNLQNLPRALKAWQAQIGVSEKDDNLVFVSAVADFLACNYGFALEAIDLPARRDKIPEHRILAAESALNLGQYTAALDHLEAILIGNWDKNRVLNFDDKIRYALLWSNFGACREGVLESEEALEAYRFALDLLPEDDGSEIALLARALIQNNLGFSLMTISNETSEDNNLAEAETLFLSALKLRENERDTEPNLCVVLLNLAEVRRKQGDPGDEMDYIDQARGLLSRLDYPHPLHASVLNAQGRATFERGDYISALDLFRQSRTKLREVYGRSLTESYVLASYSIAQTLEAMDDPAAARALVTAHSQSLEIFKDEKHPLVRLIENDMKPLH